ncbi:TrfB-related DNA-binding protein [Methylomonas methanica]|uniref:TrfB transcriptional repressor protein domain-containing protein n=1 Tax=Methylomonas methanica TaxID=421 RepID=A0A177MGJ1_METMH|nr:TrfB-related DNA-binding protein [Methylomonas methanica]OAI04898.1 hypothetical protein A1332_13815 [Methylomonas methanica]
MTKPSRKRQLTAAEFEAVRPLLNISKDRIDAAYSALVLGDVLQSVADEYGWSRQAVNDAARIVWDTFQAYKRGQEAELKALNEVLPKGWEMLVIPAPVDLINEFKINVSERRALLSLEAEPLRNLTKAELLATRKKPARRKIKIGT